MVHVCVRVCVCGVCRVVSCVWCVCACVCMRLSLCVHACACVCMYVSHDWTFLPSANAGVLSERFASDFKDKTGSPLRLGDGVRLVDVLAAQACITRRGEGATLRYIHISQLVNTGTPLPVIVEFVRSCGPGGVLAGSLAPSFLTATGEALRLVDETGQAVKLSGMLRARTIFAALIAFLCISVKFLCRGVPKFGPTPRCICMHSKAWLARACHSGWLAALALHAGLSAYVSFPPARAVPGLLVHDWGHKKTYHFFNVSKT